MPCATVAPACVCVEVADARLTALMVRQAAPQKRKVGRPIADHRHPDSPSLTPQVGHVWRCPVQRVKVLLYAVCSACRCALHVH